MDKIIKSDIVVAVIVIGTWLFYLTYEGSTRLDINQTLTLPLLAAADFTALAALYIIGRYYTAKKKAKLIGEKLNKMMTDGQAQQTQNETGSENSKS